jgi:N-acetylglucosaminyldiphosphoundecaprenol N-acetyl-beta-D-mannosaminyltransferase
MSGDGPAGQGVAGSGTLGPGGSGTLGPAITGPAAGEGRQRVHLLGVGLDPLTLPQAVARCTAAVDAGQYLPVGMVNAAKVIAMRRDERLRHAVTGCPLVLADGQSVVWASQVLGVPLPERVAGIDLFSRLLGEAAGRGHRVYFLGARPAVLDRLLAEVGRRYPALAVAGARHGYFGPDEEEGVAAQIRRAGADLVFAGMPSPKKEFFLARWGAATGASVVHGVGGSFDVLAGITRRAPGWWQRHGLEWLYRAWQEPARLGRRYLATNTAFLALVAAEAMRRGRPAPPSLPGGRR